MISNAEGWHYLFVIRLPSLLRRVTSTHNGSFCCLNYFHSFRTRYEYESCKEVFENKDFGRVIVPSKNTKSLTFTQYYKRIKATPLSLSDIIVQIVSV